MIVKLLGISRSANQIVAKCFVSSPNENCKNSPNKYSPFAYSFNHLIYETRTKILYCCEIRALKKLSMMVKGIRFIKSFNKPTQINPSSKNIC